jgi:hypothetical protein
MQQTLRRFVTAPFVLLRAVVLLVLIPGPFWIGWYHGLDLWSDIKNRETAYLPATGVRVTEFKCPGPTCTVKFDGGLSASGRSRLSYSFFESMSGREVDLVRSTVDGSISVQFARDRLVERAILFVGVELVFIGVIIFLTRYIWRSVRYLMGGS